MAETGGHANRQASNRRNVDAEILAADIARIELERGHVVLAELQRRREEAEAKAVREALVRRHAEAKASVDAAVAKIEAEYPKHAEAIAALAHDADAAAGDWYEIFLAGETDDLPAVEPVAKRLGWHAKYFKPPLFSEAPSLPAVDAFPGCGAAAKWPSPEAAYALYG